MNAFDDLYEYNQDKDSIKIYCDELQRILEERGVIIEDAELNDMKVILYVEQIKNIDKKTYTYFEKIFGDLFPMFESLKISDTEIHLYLNVQEIELL